MNEILPHPDWSHEDLRPALVNILRRLDKMFNKIAKKSSIRVRTVTLYSHLDIGIVLMVFACFGKYNEVFGKLKPVLVFLYTAVN